jgi:hypothetical protein
MSITKEIGPNRENPLGPLSTRRLYLPYHEAGFRGNPFRVLTDDELNAVAVLPRALLTVIEESGDHVQLIGEEGCGKSSALRALTVHLASAGARAAYECVPLGDSRFTIDPTPLDYFLLDEVQRLSLAEQQRLLTKTVRSGGGLRLIVATHEDLGPIFAALDLPLRTVRLDSASVQFVRAIVERRLAYFSLARPAPETFSPEAYDYLWRTFGPDLRGTERFLHAVFYELYQRREHRSAVTAAHLDAVARTIGGPLGPQ